MNHKIILKVTKLQLFSAKCFGTAEEKSPGGDFHQPPPPPHTIKGKYNDIQSNIFKLHLNAV